MMDKSVVLDDGYIMLADHYDISLNRCNDAHKILKWVVHLAPKTWVTANMIGSFVKIACQECGIEYHPVD